MSRTIIVSNEVYEGLLRQAERINDSPDALAEAWLRQHLDIERYPEIEWRHGPGGWRAGLKGTGIDVYTVVGYSKLGYSAERIADEILPHLALEQVRAALRYYADYPDEIERILMESTEEASKARLYRALGPSDYRKLTGLKEPPAGVSEAPEPEDSA